MAHDYQQDQLNLSSLVVIVVIVVLVIRYFFWSPAATGTAARGSSGGTAAGPGIDQGAAWRAREAAVERLQQMFPQADRRVLLWDLQRNQGNLAATTERILAGRLETPPVTFQPPPPPNTNNNTNANPAQKPAEKPAQPDLITRYNLKSKLERGDTGAPATGGGKAKGWSSNREERQTLLQRRRDQMIIEARRKMEAKIAAEKAAAGNA